MLLFVFKSCTECAYTYALNARTSYMHVCIRKKRKKRKINYERKNVIFNSRISTDAYLVLLGSCSFPLWSQDDVITTVTDKQIKIIND